MFKRFHFWESLKKYDDIIPLHKCEGTFIINSIIDSNDLKNKVIADMGCGFGYWLSKFQNSQKVYAVDYAKNMLQKAKKNNLNTNNIIYINENMANVKLPEKSDFIMSLHSFMPESHSMIKPMLRNILSNIKPGGTLFMVVPSFETHIYILNLWHYYNIEIHQEKQSIKKLMNRFLKYYNNPLGYIRYSSGQVVKHWIKEEFEAVIKEFDIIESYNICKIPLGWQYFNHPIWQKNYPPPWSWAFHIKLHA